MNNLDLVNYAKNALSGGWGYVWGTFGQVLTPEFFQEKLRQYPDGVGRYSDFVKSHWMNRHVTDCVGLIKGCYWDGSYNGSTDVSADGMYENANKKGDISTIPDIPGICVHKNGHIGVYIGNGQVIEAHGTMYGVIKTPLHGGTPWTNWLECPYISYTQSSTQLTQPSNEGSLVAKGKRYVGSRCLELQQKLIKLGYSCGLCGADNDFGKATYNALIAFQKDNGLEVDGEAGDLTFAKLESLILQMNKPIFSGNDWVRRLQSECNAQGFSNQVVDGYPGANTLEGCVLLRKGDRGNLTKLLQEKLVSLGYNTNGVDGIYGNGTYNAVVAFQKNNGLGADGIVGRNTWRKLLGL